MVHTTVSLHVGMSKFRRKRGVGGVGLRRERQCPGMGAEVTERLEVIGCRDGGDADILTGSHVTADYERLRRRDYAVVRCPLKAATLCCTVHPECNIVECKLSVVQCLRCRTGCTIPLIPFSGQREGVVQEFLAGILLVCEFQVCCIGVGAVGNVFR